MKNLKIKLILAMILSFIIISCNKEVRDSVETGSQKGTEPAPEFKSKSTNQFQGLNDDFDRWYEQNSDRLDEVVRTEIIAFEDLEVQVMIFNVIPPERKAFVWREKFDELLESNHYDNKQKAFINSLKARAKTNLYKNPNVAEAQINYFNKRREFGANLFSDEELRSIMINLDNISPAISGSGASLCKCSTDSDWCDVPVAAGTCSGDCGLSTSSGCGTLWGYSCNGICVFNVPPPTR